MVSGETNQDKVFYRSIKLLEELLCVDHIPASPAKKSRGDLQERSCQKFSNKRETVRVVGCALTHPVQYIYEY